MKAKGLRLPPLPEVSLEHWANLFSLADLYVEAEPWTALGNADIFCVVDEASGRSGWAVVLGGGRQVFGLGLYQGLRGLAQLKANLESEDGIPGDRFNYIASLDLLNYNWAPRRELSEVDLGVLKRVGRRITGQKMYHQFQSYRPGYVPWALDEGEVLFMMRGLEAALILKHRIDEGVIPFSSGMIPLVKFTREQKAELGLVDPEVWYEPAMEPVKLTEEQVRSLQGVPRAGIWQGGHFYVPGQIMEGDRPYHVHMAVLVDAASGFVMPVQMLKPQDSLPQAFVQGLLGSGVKEKVLPAEIEFRDLELMKAVSQALEKLGVKARYKDVLLELDEVAEALRDQFSRGV